MEFTREWFCSVDAWYQLLDKIWELREDHEIVVFFPFVDRVWNLNKDYKYNDYNALKDSLTKGLGLAFFEEVIVKDYDTRQVSIIDVDGARYL